MQITQVGWLLVFVLLGCQPASREMPSDAPFVISGDTVILHKSHILSTKTALYQPSFALQGILLPNTQTDITADQAGIITQVHVHASQVVQQKDALFVLNLPTEDNTPDTNTKDNQQSACADC